MKSRCRRKFKTIEKRQKTILSGFKDRVIGIIRSQNKCLRLQETTAKKEKDELIILILSLLTSLPEMCTQACTCTHVHTNSHTQAHICTHAHTPTHRRTHAHMHTHTPTHRHTCTHAHPYTGMHMHTCTHTHTQVCTCTHTPTHMHAHAHTYTHT